MFKGLKPCFVFIWEQTATCATYSINWLVFITQIKSVYSAVRTGSLNQLVSSLLYTVTILKPVWTYGIELWGCTNKPNITVMRRYQSKLLRTITNAPRYVTNHTLHTDLHIPYVRTAFHDRTNKHHTTLPSHPNPIMEPMLQPAHNRRLKRRWTFDQTFWGGIVGCLPRPPTTMPAH